MKRYIFIICLIVIAACRPEISGDIAQQPDIFPDYTDVTIPCNIAPMNFQVISQEGTAWMAEVAAEDENVFIHSGNGLISFRKWKWKKLLSAGGELSIRIYEKRDGKWLAYQKFSMYVNDDKVDPYLAYRLITPGYSLWREMSICQRDLESFKERRIYSNTQGKGNCVNCHSFCDRNPDQMLFHLRSEFAGTYIFRNGGREKLDTRADSLISALVYPYWHTSGHYVAFSVNRTNQVLHSIDPNRIEVFDEASDVVVYDVDNHRIVTADHLSSAAAFETFPTFSPDGRSLYFCSAKAVEPMPEGYKEVRYSLCRVDFDPSDCSFGQRVDTLYNAAVQGGSVSFPRISPDGRFLAFTLSGYGTFSIWHKDADVYCIDLQSGGLSEMAALNSDDVESYHSWSGNSRWMVVSSRRDDGLYTRPYISYVDEKGMAYKPFLLPQKHPKKYYDSQMFSFNIPEFVEGQIDLSGRQIADFAAKAKDAPVVFVRKN
jgi:hypothetical protein